MRSAEEPMKNLRWNLLASVFMLLFSFASISNGQNCVLIQEDFLPANYNSNISVAANLNEQASLFVQVTNEGKALIWRLHRPKEIPLTVSPDRSLGQYYVNPYFSWNSSYVALDSVLRNKALKTHGRIDILNILTGKIAHKLMSYIWGGQTISKFDFSPTNENLLAYVPDDGSEGKTILVLDLTSGKLVSKLNYGFCTIDALAFHPTQFQMAVKDICGNAVRIFNLDSGEILSTLIPSYALPDSYQTVNKGLLFWGNGTMLATHSTEAEAVLTWDLASQQPTFDTFWIDPLPMVASRDTQYLALADYFGDLNILNVVNPGTPFILTPFGTFNPVWSASFSTSDRYLVTSSGQGSLAIFDGRDFHPVCGGSLSDSDSMDQIVFEDDKNFLTLTGSYNLVKWTIKE
jgi:WD40 repeat protein